MTGYEGLDSPTSPKYGSPKYSEETVTCNSDGKHDNDYIKGEIKTFLSDNLQGF